MRQTEPVFGFWLKPAGPATSLNPKLKRANLAVEAVEGACFQPACHRSPAL